MTKWDILFLAVFSIAVAGSGGASRYIKSIATKFMSSPDKVLVAKKEKSDAEET